MDPFARENPKASIIIQDIPPEEPPYIASLIPPGEVILCFGLRKGVVEKILSEGKTLIVLENHLPYIHSFLSSEGAEEAYATQKFHLFAYGPFAPLPKIAETIAWQFPEKELGFLLYNEEKGGEELIRFESAKTNDLLDEYKKFGIVFYRNLYRNFPKLPDCYNGSKLFGKFEGVPAIICGAGPSLNKQLPLLKTLQDKALIFAGGSSLGPCITGGVRPHFGAGIDPNPLQFDRISSHSAQDIPFFFRGRFFHRALDLLTGPKLYITGAGGYDTAGWLENELGIEGVKIDEGHNVVNFLIEIAHSMGCNPLVFIGLDLAYTGGKAYTQGVAESTVSKDGLVEKPDYQGNPVLTEWKWLKEAEWIGEYAEKHPEITFLNCTEGGISIPKIPEVPFQDAIRTFSKRDLSLETAIKNARFTTLTKEKIHEALTKLEASLENLIEHFDTLMEVEPGSGFAALAETEIQEEVAYPAVLEMFAAIWNMTLHPPKTPQEANEKRKEKYLYLRRVAEANLILMREAAGKGEETRSS